MRRSALLICLGVSMTTAADAQPNPPPKPVDAEAVARLPHPGTATPGAIAFAADGKSVTYLKPATADSLSRVLWRADIDPKAEPRIIASPPGGGDTDANVSREEALRRERQRLRETGIAQVARAENADVFVIPLGGDVYYQAGDSPLRRLTTTSEPEIDPRPSDDGSKVAFVRAGELHVMDVGSGKETRLSGGASDGLSNGLAEFIAQEELGRQVGYWWSPDGTRIAYQETDERHIPTYTIAHQGGDLPSIEAHRYPFAGRPNAKVRLGVVGVLGGATRWLDWKADDEDAYLARARWDGPTRLLAQVLSRDQKSLRLVRFDLDSGSRTTLIEERSEPWINLSDDLRLVAGTGEILWSSERTGFRHLELRDRDGAFVRSLTSGDWPVDAVVALDSKRREVWFTSGRESPPESHLYRVSLDGGEPLKVTRARGMHRAVVSKDGDHFVDVASSRRHAPVTTLCDRSGRAIATLDDASTDPRIRTYAFSTPKLTEFKNRDGITLFGAYYEPMAAFPGGRTPLVAMVYGGPHVQRVMDSWDLTADLAAQYLAARGFAVWKCDNRGSARRGLAFEGALDRNMGSVEVRDQVDGVRFAAASWPEIDSGKVGITGGSYGGYMTLRCLTEAPDVFRAGVAVAPVTDWDGYDTGYTERYMGTPANNPTGYAASSVLNRAQALSGDLLLIHGLLDENVHFRHTARLVNALIAAGKPFELLPLPDERHSSRRPAERKYVAEKTADFFEKTLGK